MASQDLDKTDRRLLHLLQKNNRRPLREMAAELSISAPTCLRRVRRLEQRGVIRAHCALINRSQVGLGVLAYVEVSLVDAAGHQMTSFERRMQRCAEVLQCSELAGDIDYLLTIVARDLPAFSEFTRKHLGDDRLVKTYRSLLVMRQTKNEHLLPIVNGPM